MGFYLGKTLQGAHCYVDMGCSSNCDLVLTHIHYYY